MKRFLSVGFGLIVTTLFMLTMVSTAGAVEKPDPKTTAVLKAAGASPGGVGFVVLTGLSKWVSDVYPRIEITVVPGGFVGNLMRTHVGEVDISATTISLAAMAANKLPPYDKENISNVRALMSTQDRFHFFAIVRKDLPVDSIGDMFRKKLPLKLTTLHKGTATELVWGGVFKSQGIGWDDIQSQWGGRISFVSWADAVNLIKDGHADGVLAVGGYKIGWAMELAHARDVKILKWDPEILQYASETFGLMEGVIPGGSYTGVNEDVLVPYTPCQIVVNKRIPDKVVRAMLTGIYENADNYAKHHPDLKGFTASGMAKGLRLPLHPAAEAFYRDYNIPLK
jgi:uncharacterized protein